MSTGFISEIVAQYGVWLWFALAVALLILELIVPGVHFVWFGLSAMVVGILALVLPLVWQWQLILFALISLVTVFVVQNRSRKESSAPDVPDLNVRGAQYVGRVVTVEDAITNGRGRVRIGDTIWLAEGEDAPAGSRVKVVGVDGTALVVSRQD